MFFITEKEEYSTSMDPEHTFVPKIWLVFILGGIISGLIYFFNTVRMDTQNTSEESAKNQTPEHQELTEEQRHILFEKGTERPFTSDLLNEKRAGTYYAADTRQPVFRSEDKFDSGTGWPSFTKPVSPEAVEEESDTSLGMTRTEVLSTEGGHLGHVFTDGPQDKGGLRYCINGDALYFVPDAPENKGE